MYNWKQGFIIHSRLWAVLGNIVSSIDDKIYGEIVISGHIHMNTYVCVYSCKHLLSLYSV